VKVLQDLLTSAPLKSPLQWTLFSSGSESARL
jgi:hypothetical protein